MEKQEQWLKKFLVRYALCSHTMAKRENRKGLTYVFTVRISLIHTGMRGILVKREKVELRRVQSVE